MLKLNSNLKSFSLAEMMIVILVITVILAATMPLVTKKSKTVTTGVTQEQLEALQAQVDELEVKARHGQVMCTTTSTTCTGNIGGEDGATVTNTSTSPYTFTFTPPTGVTTFYITAVGAGGGNGGTSSSGTGGAGGAGEVVYGKATVSSNATIYVGSGGSAPTWSSVGARGLGYGNGVAGSTGEMSTAPGGGGGGSSAFVAVNTVSARGGGGGGGGGYYVASKAANTGGAGGRGGVNVSSSYYSGGAGGTQTSSWNGVNGGGSTGLWGYGLTSTGGFVLVEW